MNIKKFLIIIIPLFVFKYLYTADSDLSSYQFLNSFYSPRLSALGGSHPTIKGDLDAIFGNPAGLAYLKNTRIMINYNNHLLDFNNAFLGIHYPLNDYFNISVGLLYMDYGKFERVDEFALKTGEKFDSREMSLQSSFSGYLLDWVSYGATLKYIYSNIFHYSASAVAADLGILISVPYLYGLDIGLNIKNLGKSIDAFDQTKEDLPFVFSVGMAKHFMKDRHSIYFGWTQLPLYTSDNTQLYKKFSIGLESIPIPALKIRVGYNNGTRNNLMIGDYSGVLGISCGFALEVGSQQLAYGYSNYGELGGVHLFGFSYTFQTSQKREASSNGSSQARVIFELNEIPPPQQVQYRVVSGQLLISWRGFEGATYNLYARHGDDPNWTKMNSKPLEDNFVAFKKPKVPGFYYFKITAVYQGKESYFSEQLEIIID
ncbi:MAG: PorV/PorQ family protein [bacterium]|nr:MAG: PorV/PorQ family protein [bacterium]